VKRGFGYLMRDDLAHEIPVRLSGGWRLREPGYIEPGSYADYTPVDEADHRDATTRRPRQRRCP